MKFVQTLMFLYCSSFLTLFILNLLRLLNLFNGLIICIFPFSSCFDEHVSVNGISSKSRMTFYIDKHDYLQKVLIYTYILKYTCKNIKRCTFEIFNKKNEMNNRKISFTLKFCATVITPSIFFTRWPWFLFIIVDS